MISRRALASILLAAPLAAGRSDAMVRAGESVPVDVQSDHPYVARGRMVLTRTLSYDGARWLRVHFASFDLAPGDKVEIADGRGRTVASYSGRGRHDLGAFWSTVVDGDRLEVRLVAAPGSRAPGFAIDRLAHGDPARDDDASRSPCGVDDSQQAKCFLGQAPYDRAMRVGRMIFESPPGSGIFFACTGWLASCQDHFISNFHCVDTQAELDTLVVRFDFETQDCAGNGLDPVDTYDGGTFLATSGDITLDWSVMTLDGLPSARYGWLDADPRPIVQGEPLYIAGHPLNRPKRIVVNYAALGNCQADSFDANNVLYQCDTDSGSSGSPVLDANNHVVALHHLGGCPNAAARLELFWPQIAPFLPASCGPAIDQIAVSPGAGPANASLVLALRSNGSSTGLDVIPYAGYAFGDNVAVTDPDGAGFHDVLTGGGPDPALASTVLGCDRFGTPLAGLAFDAYAVAGYGANVSGGELDGDASAEVLTAPGPGGTFGPQVRAFNYGGGTVTPIGKINFYAYGTLRYGCLVGAGDVDGDAFEEILTGAGPGSVFGPHVRGFNFDNVALTPMAKVSFFAYQTLKYGVNVAAGDHDGDGFAEIATGPGPGAAFGAQLKGFDYDAAGVSALPGFNAFMFAATRYGLDLATGELTGDARRDIATAPGPDPSASAVIRAASYSGSSIVVIPALDGVIAVPSALYGTEVGAGDLGL